MKITEYAELDGLAIADLVRRGKATPAEVAEAAIAAVEAVNPAVNAVVLLDADGARAQAAALDRNAPLAGMPMLVKDNNLQVAGWPTTFSSRFFADSHPRPDSTLVARLRRAGVVLVGKVNTPEFALDWTTEPTFRGPTRNPWNPDRSAGGSSGGSAASVASRMVPAAHGNDNAGSIRVPSAVCGLFGLKPTRGLVPIGPYFPELAAGHDCEHALTRSVRDSAALLDATAGPETGSRYQVRRSVPSYLAALENAPPRLSIGVVTRRPDGEAVQAEIGEAVEGVARLFAQAGHTVSEVAFPNEPGLSADNEVICFVEVAMLLRRRAREVGREPRRDELEALTALALERARDLGAVAYLEARQRVHETTTRIMEELSRFDLLVTPTTARTAPRIGEFDTRTERFDYDENGRLAAGFAPFTELFSLTGQPAASFPAALDRGGLPIGVQLAGAPGRDDLVLQAAGFLEKRIDALQQPPVCAGRSQRN